MIKKIEIKTYRDNKSKLLDSKEADSNKDKVVTLSNYDFDHLVEDCLAEKLSSSKPIFSSILFLRNQEKSSKDYCGD
jgi:hypothetical protein